LQLNSSCRRPASGTITSHLAGVKSPSRPHRTPRFSVFARSLRYFILGSAEYAGNCEEAGLGVSRITTELSFLPYSFSPYTSRLQSALRRSTPKFEVASARRKLPDDDSTLPRLLTSVYTPLLRCATASDACGLAGGLRTKQTGNTSQVPRFAFLGIASDGSIQELPTRYEHQHYFQLRRLYGGLPFLTDSAEWR
jgi:hypothetical protein